MTYEAKRWWDEDHARMSKNKQSSSSAVGFERELPRNSTILDLGGGTGAEALHFLRQGHVVTLVDISEVALSVVAERAKEGFVANKLTTLQVDFGSERLPIEDNTMDSVYAGQSLHFFDLETTATVVSEIQRVLRPRGGAFITAKSPDDPVEMEFLKRTAQEIQPSLFLDNPGVTRSRYAPEQWQSILKEAGVKEYEMSQIREDLSQSRC